ncbi:MAG: NUDIX hydrolase [Candidatus Thermoplasmatota archaeon]|nr:NUDIX hydrolase [Candidatus Thermoplasmatota archaeon]
MYRNPSLAVDAVVMREGKILLVRRKNEPYRGMLALPGGFVEYGEKTEEAVLRELKEETGMKGRIKRLAGVFSDPERDPRGHVVSIAYLVEPVSEGIKAGDDAAGCEWVKIKDIKDLAFDHREIVKKALEMIE